MSYLKNKAFEHVWKGIKFENPFVLASCPISHNGEMIMRAFSQGWGGAVTKTITNEHEKIINATPRFFGLNYSTKKNDPFRPGFQNTELISRKSLDWWSKEISTIKKQYPEKVIISSIMADCANNWEGWQKMVKVCEKAGSDIIELNLSCPNFGESQQMGSIVSQQKDLSGEIVKCCKDVAKTPVLAKLSPNVSSITDLTKICMIKGGADGIATINTVKGFAGINIDTLEPKLNINGESVYGGFSGRIIKPIALKMISEIARKCGNPYISGIGGIADYQDAIEFILLGSSSVQVCTEVMLKGFGIIKSYLKGLEKFMDKNNFGSLKEMIGYSLPLIKDFDDLDFKTKNIAFIDKEKCKKCGRCFVSSQDAAYQCIYKDDEKYCVVDKDKCDGCGLCTIVCPYNAVKMVKKE